MLQNIKNFLPELARFAIRDRRNIAVLDSISRTQNSLRARHLHRNTKARVSGQVFLVEMPEVESGSESGHSSESTVRSFTFDLDIHP